MPCPKSVLAQRSVQGVVVALLIGAAVVLGGPPVLAFDPNACDAPGDEPDVIVGDIYQRTRHGTLNGITAFSLGAVSCNVGTCWLNWISSTDQHPVIGQNMFRLKDGRFEHVGQSWLKHGFFATSETLCSTGCLPTDGDHLGVNCSDAYSSFLNGQQGNLGPKFEVNPTAGTHIEPFSTKGQTGNVIYKRLQVKNVDLDPLLNPAARYFVEVQYVTQDDAAATNQENNASYREASVSGTSPTFDFTLIGTVQQQKPGIRAWQDADPGVSLVQAHADGLFLVGVKVTPTLAGTWHYEYAVQNLTSHRGARSFKVPVPAAATLSAIEFHDVDYHSGEPFDGTDWTDNGGAASELTWSTLTFDEDPNANALRWGTLYNFRFDANVPPALNQVTLGLFGPGSPTDPTEIDVAILTPQTCFLNGTCEAGETCANCAADCADGVCDGVEDACTCTADCGAPLASEGDCTDAVDADCDGLTDCADPDCCTVPVCGNPDGDGDTVPACADCDDTNVGVWGTPVEVNGLLLHKVGFGSVKLSWDPVSDAGAVFAEYDAIRSSVQTDFVTDIRCLQNVGTTAEDIQVPASEALFCYLVRATNACPTGNDGPAGSGSNGVPKPAATCADPP